MADDVRWLTYDEVAAEFGIERESARQLAIRKRWQRRKGNDGKARVGVPEEEFQARTAEITPQAPSHRPSDEAGQDPSVIQVLTRHISRLEAELETVKQERDTERTRLAGEIDSLKAERDAERLRAAQVEALKAAIEAGRERAEEWKAVADRFASQAEAMAARRSWWPWRRKA